MERLICTDRGYPARLREYTSPPILYASQMLDIGARDCVLFAGTRKPDHEAFRQAGIWAGEFARRGWIVVTSSEGGCDLAVRIELKRRGVKPVVMMGEGLGERTDEGMILVSPYPSGTRRSRETLLGRNQIAAALCRLTVIVQAPEKSGALLVARDALDSGGDVVLLPSAVGEGPLRAGGNRLYEEGAPVLGRCVNKTSFVVHWVPWR